MEKGKWLRAAIIAILGVVILGAGIIILKNDENAQYQESRETMSEGFGRLKTVTINGKTYREKPAVTTILIAGVDKENATENVTPNSYRNGGQADFLLLAAIDHTDKTVHQVQIDRDTMTDVAILGVFGNEVGTRVLQICLAHSFGATPQDNAKYTVRAVQNLMDGIKIDGYYMIDYSVVPTLNDALGGVPVKIEFDMENLNPTWEKGSTVILYGKDAETFVRARMSVGSGTNEERMVRQNEYMKNAIKKMNQKIEEDIGFGEELLNTLQSVSTTNMPVKQLAEELNQAHEYQISEVEHLKGTYKKGEDGFKQFHLEEGAAVEWVLEHLYTPVE